MPSLAPTRGAWSWQGWQGLLDHSSYGFGAQPKKGGEGAGAERGGREGRREFLRLSLWQGCFFFSFFPFFLK